MTTATSFSEKPVLLAADLHAGYGQRKVLTGLDLKVNAGEIVAVFGNNGSGKSTLLKALVGLVKLQRGQVIYDGQEISHVLPSQIRHLGIGLLMQGARVFPNLTVAENIQICDGHSSDGADLQAINCIFPHLQQLRRRRAGLLSAGERQMLSIAMLLVQKPRLLLLDEPSAYLASSVVTEVFSHFAAYAKQLGSAVLLVEQNIRASQTLADRCLVLSDGMVQNIDA